MVPVRGLGRPFSDWYLKRPARAKPDRLDDFVRAGLLVVMHENQGVCTWAVKLDGTDDPPVVVEVDSIDSAASPSEARWEPCADSFSTFMYCRAWDHGHCLAGISVTASANDRPLAPGDLSLLQSHFSEGPRTHGHPGVTNYRFFTRNSAILIWDGEDHELRGGQADWWLMATSDEQCWVCSAGFGIAALCVRRCTRTTRAHGNCSTGCGRDRGQLPALGEHDVCGARCGTALGARSRGWI